MDDAIDLSRMRQSSPPDDLWSAINGELGRRRRRRFLRGIFAAAAMVAVVVAASIFVQMSEPTPSPGVETSGRPEVTLADLRAASAQLESQLADNRRRPVGGLELESLMWIEAELAWLDEQLTDSPKDRHLWWQRIELLAELNRRYADGDWRRGLLLAGV